MSTDTELLDASTAREHITALRAKGFGLRAISKASGVPISSLKEIVIGYRGTRRGTYRRRVRPHVHDAIMAVPIPDETRDWSKVNAIPIVRRLEALVAAGYTRAYLAQRIGMSQQNMGRLMLVTDGQVSTVNAEKVRELFGELRDTPGESRWAINEGERRGWIPAYAWDEDKIDEIVVDPYGYIENDPMEGR